MIAPDRKGLQYISWLTLLGMSAIGVLLISYLQKKGIQDVLLGGRPYYLQAITGLFFGSLAALLAVLFINGKRFKTVRRVFEDRVKEINPSFLDILFYSICFGVGEEVLFRAGIQPLPHMGIWPAAILFVLLHGYINPSNFNLTLYGLFLVLIGSGFGYLFKFFGLTSSVIAHCIYDLSIFSVMKYSYKRDEEATKAI